MKLLTRLHHQYLEFETDEEVSTIDYNKDGDGVFDDKLNFRQKDGSPIFADGRHEVFDVQF